MADNSHIQILEVSKNDTSFDCDLCNRKFNKISFFKSHYFRVHNKCLIVMPVKNEKDSIKPKTKSQTKSKKNTATKIVKKKKTPTKIGKRKKTAKINEKKKKTTVKIEKTGITENDTETEIEIKLCLTTEAENEILNVKKTDPPAENKKTTAAKIEKSNATTVKVEKADIVSEPTTENVKEINLTTQAENFHIKKKIKKEIFHCEMCKATFNSFVDLDKHSLSHEQESKNNIIDKEKPIVCAECGENFTLESAHTKHKLLHTLKCDRCGESFDSLELNFMKTHVCVGEYDVMSECEVCGKALKNNRNLRAHRRIKHGLHDNIV